MKSLLLIVLLLGVVYTHERELQSVNCNLSKNGRCGKSFGNTICVAGYCSKWNWCGTSALHKRTHQPAFDAKPACASKKPLPKKKACNVSKNGRCGKHFGSTICPAGYCSRWNWCGTSALHKSTHQPAFDAKAACKKAVKKVEKKLVKKAGAKKSAKCNVSKNGRCGKSFHNTICAYGYCSKWNWCGNSALHKSTHQPAFDAKKACSKKPVRKVVKKAKKVTKSHQKEGH